jgi:hypothetical protein
MKTKTNKRRTLTISHSSSDTTTFTIASPPLDDVEGTGEEEEEALCCCTPLVTRTPSTMRTGKDMLGMRRATSKTRDEEETI